MEGEAKTEVSANGDDRHDECVLEIQISVEMDREAAESVQLEAARLLTQLGLKVRAVKVTRASASEAEDLDEAT
jgi:hypothetical protein